MSRHHPDSSDHKGGPNRRELDEALTVALVEDNLDHAILATDALEERGHRVVCFQNGEKAISACQTQRWDAIILDYVLPDWTGLELIETFASLPQAPPIVMVTASGSEEIAVAALKRGASDYVVKTGRHGQELARAVELAVAKRRLDHMVALRQREIERQANTDPLTGLLNRRRLALELGLIARRAGELGEPYAVAMIDIDNFKQINDTRGHAVGDAVLLEFAAILRRCSRKDDLIARYGGDEFVVVMPRARKDSGSALISRLDRALGQVSITGRLNLSLSAAVGIADSSAGSSDQVLKQADTAMYRNKQARRQALSSTADSPEPNQTSARDRERATADRR